MGINAGDVITLRSIAPELNARAEQLSKAPQAMPRSVDAVGIMCTVGLALMGVLSAVGFGL